MRPAAPEVLVVAYEADDHLARCLAELGAGNRVLVLDNASTGAARSIAAAAGARYVSTGRNLGFAAGVNRGLAELPAERDVLVLNPDARIGWPDVLRLQDALVDGVAAVGPRLTGPDGVAQRAQWPIPSPAQMWLEAVGLHRLWRGRRFVTGAVLLLNADALAEIGGLDERFFLYAEEADWQLRAQRAGWRVAVVADVTAGHVGAASSTDDELRDERFHTSQTIFATKWYGPARRGSLRAARVVAATRRALIGSAESRAYNRRMLRRHLRRAGAA